MMTNSEARDILAEMRDQIPEDFQQDRAALDYGVKALGDMENAAGWTDHAARSFWEMCVAALIRNGNETSYPIAKLADAIVGEWRQRWAK